MIRHAASRTALTLISILALLLSLLATLVVTRPVAAQTEFVAILSGAAEVPGPGDDDGSGFSSLVVDPAAGQICPVDIGVSDIAAATAAHIHEGADGVAGPVVVTLPTPDADGFASDCLEGLDTTLLQDIHDNPTNYYINVHNADFPDGAVRGQLGPPPIALSARLDGASEVPGPGDPDGSGDAQLSFFADAGEICAFIGVSDIAQATAAHIHSGAAGVAGPVVITLPTPNAEGSVDGCVAGQDPALLQQIIDTPADFYVNVHTADFPDGAVRGQLGAPPTQLFARLDGASEVPGTGDPDGSGFSVLELFVEAGRICGFLEVTAIATATAAHIHAGAAGVAGDIVVTLLTPDADGFADGCVDGLDPALLQQIADDPASFYVNVHNAEYPAGGVRGQLSFEPPPPPECEPGVLCDGELAPGTYTYTGFGTDLTFTTTTPWLAFQDDVPSLNLYDFEALQGGLFGFPFGGSVFADPCDVGSVTTIGTSPAELMVWLGDRGFMETTAPIPVTYGGASGLQIDLVSTAIPAECTDPPLAFVFELGLNDYYFETGSIGRIVALDVAGETIVFIAEAFPGSPDSAAFVTVAQGVLDSFVWALGGAPSPTPPAASPTPAASGLPNTATGTETPLSGPGSAVPFAVLAGAASLLYIAQVILRRRRPIRGAER